MKKLEGMSLALQFLLLCKETAFKAWNYNSNHLGSITWVLARHRTWWCLVLAFLSLQNSEKKIVIYKLFNLRYFVTAA
jgi:hypothetical protein